MGGGCASSLLPKDSSADRFGLPRCCPLVRSTIVCPFAIRLRSFFDAWNLVKTQTSPCFRWDLAEPRVEQGFQSRWAVDCESVRLTKRGIGGIGGDNELSQIYEAGSPDLCGQARPNGRKCLKRMISKMDSRKFPTCCVRVPNPPSSEAKTRLFAHEDPFAFGRLSSVGPLGRSVSPSMSPSPECLQDAGSSPLFGPRPAGREGLLYCSSILLRNRLIETELDCSATEGRADAS